MFPKNISRLLLHKEPYIPKPFNPQHLLCHRIDLIEIKSFPWRRVRHSQKRATEQSLSMVVCQSREQEPTEIITDTVDSGEIFVIKYSCYLRSHFLSLVFGCRCGLPCVAVAQEVGAKDSVADSGGVGYLVPPVRRWRKGSRGGRGLLVLRIRGMWECGRRSKWLWRMGGLGVWSAGERLCAPLWSGYIGMLM